MTQRCIYCMSELKPNVQFCPKCHRSTSPKTKPDQLAPGTILDGTIQVGGVIFEDAYTLTYAGRDIRNHDLYWVVEYFPKSIAKRQTAVSLNIEPGEEFQQTFARLGQELTENLYNLMHAGSMSSLMVPVGMFGENMTCYALYPFLDSAITLQKYIEINGPQTFDAALELLRPVMKDLYILHKNRLLHTRISPETLLVSNKQCFLSGYGLRADLNLAKALRSGNILEKGYAAAEQLRPGGVVKSGSDVYSLAAVFYFVLSGIRPADVRTKDHYTELHTANPKLPKAVCQVIDQALSSSMESRFSSVDAFLKSLLEAEEKSKHAGQEPTRSQAIQQAVAACAPAPEERVWKTQQPKPIPKRKKKQQKTMPTIVCGLVLIAIGIGMALAAPKFDSAAQYAAQTTPGHFENGKINADAIENLQAVDTGTLKFENCDFSTMDLSKLTSNPIIERIEIKNPTGLKSLSFIKNFPDIKQLVLNDCSLTDSMLETADLANMKNLEAISINDNSITSLDFLKNLSRMRIVYAANNQIKDMSPLAELYTLEKVVLSGNEIETFIPLHTQHPVVVDVRSNKIGSIQTYNQNGMPFITYYELLALNDNPIFEAQNQEYGGITSLNGRALIVSYAFNDSQVTNDGTNMAVYDLTYDNFQTTMFVDLNEESETWVSWYFGSKNWSSISSADASKMIKTSLKS